MADIGRQQIREFLACMSERMRAVITEELDKNPRIADLVKELRSLGIVCVLEHDCNVQLFVRDSFIPPKDLSGLEETRLDAMFNDEDRQMLRRIMEDN